MNVGAKGAMQHERSFSNYEKFRTVYFHNSLNKASTNADFKGVAGACEGVLLNAVRKASRMRMSKLEKPYQPYKEALLA